MMRRLFVTAVMAGALVALVAGSYVYWALSTPTQTAQRISLTIEPGTTLKPVLRQLGKAGVIRHPQLLYVYGRLSGQTDVKAGSFETDGSVAPEDILAELVKGQVRMASVTIAEGLNRWEVRDLMVEAGWMTAETFDALCDDGAFLASHGVPGPSCDGYLFPETYRFAQGVEPQAIFATLFEGYRQAFQAALAKGRGPMNLDDRELTTLASIVEKETSIESERPRIACVFYNRLTADEPWRLQTDPTVIYAARLEDPDFDGNIKRSHLRNMPNPYNTYHIYGLPPGPIASPGAAAFDAVVQPMTCKDFFFVSRNDGHHIFCPTLDCHNRAVQKWQVNYFRKSKR